MMKVLNFAGIFAAMALCYTYVPFGGLICIGINLVALWKLVNEK